MKTTILFLLSAICAVAQTNIVTTNQPVTLTTKTNKPANLQPKIVTKEMVLQGLTTISNQIATLRARRVELDNWFKNESKKNKLKYQAGQITAKQVIKTREDLPNQINPEEQEISRQTAVLKLQELEIRQRYAQLLKPE
jgi:predicted phage-related endonuclease